VTDIINVKAALANILFNKEFIGLIVTGFDADHFNEVGMKIVLNKYRPNWIMYPKYFKQTKTADECFAVIDAFESQKKFPRYSVSLSANERRFYAEISNNIVFEVFSPHAADMNSSNNCSLVCKIKEKSTNATYLVTGDTENDRWKSIVNYFSKSLASDVLAAPHHGSKNGISTHAIAHIAPKTVLISAGVDNQYGHPDREAINHYSASTVEIYSTNHGQGQSLKTIISSSDVRTVIFK
jgi:competence protein ComEC